MILPSKHLAAERALLTLGGEILKALDQPRTISSLWDRMRSGNDVVKRRSVLTYSWFILAIDLLFIVRAVSYEDGTLRKNAP